MLVSDGGYEKMKDTERGDLYLHAQQQFEHSLVEL